MSRLSSPYSKHPKDMTLKERIAWMNSIEGLRQIEYDMVDALNRNETIPREWNDIWRGEDRDTKRIRVTVSLDADVVRFFKALGPGYQPRMNRVLRSFMQARLAKIVDGPENEEMVRR
ncbi:MAG: BrnA antitoxin family protein [Pseudomonadota bacterium]